MRRGLAIAWVLLVAPAALAGPRATSVELFAHGRALAMQGKCAEAVPFFLDTLKIEPSIGALLNLADCRDKLGRSVEAYEDFREAESLARARADDRASLAHERAVALAAHLPKIAVTAPAGSRVTVDGRDASAAVVVAPGEHVVRVTADGAEPWQTSARAIGAESTVVLVPALTPVVTRAAGPARPGRGRATAGIVVAVAGGVGLALSGVFGAVALAKKSDAVTLAVGPSEADFDAARGAAATFGDASTVALVAGAVLLGAGLALWLTSPRVSVAVAPGLNAWGVLLTATF